MSTDGPSEKASLTSRGKPDRGSLGRLRTVALIAVVVGAAASVGIMLRVGHRNNADIPFVLLILFTGWVLSPFIALVLAAFASTRWSVLTTAPLHSVMLMVTLGSLAIYGYVALSPPRPKPAFVFLTVPLASWLFMTIVVSLAALVSGKRSHRGPGG